MSIRADRQERRNTAHDRAVFVSERRGEPGFDLFGPSRLSHHASRSPAYRRTRTDVPDVLFRAGAQRFVDPDGEHPVPHPPGVDGVRELLPREATAGVEERPEIGPACAPLVLN